MADIADLEWLSGGTDIHLVEGMKTVLNRLLRITYFDESNKTRGDNLLPGNTLAFTTLADLASAGVTLDTLTGEIEFNGPLPDTGDRLLNFVVIATGTGTQGAFTNYIRIHLHKSLKRIWLTPSSLTVRQQAKNASFTLLAEFADSAGVGDGVYGDITNWSSFFFPNLTGAAFVSWLDDGIPVLDWESSDPAQLSVGPRTGLLVCKSATAVAGVLVTARARPGLTPPPPALTTDAVALGAPPWSSMTAMLERIAGPGFDHMAKVVNFVILPEGFDEDEKPEFEQLAGDLVRQLQTVWRTRPFDLFGETNVNYFRAWVPSPQRGISALSTMRRSNVAGTKSRARERDTAVGAGQTIGAGETGVPPTADKDKTYLLNERDTAFHMAVGYRPTASLDPGDSEIINLNPRRLDNDEFMSFIAGLTRPKLLATEPTTGVKVGSIWMSPNGGDLGRILILCRTRRSSAGFLLDNWSSVTSGTTDYHTIEEVPNGLEIQPDSIGKTVSIFTQTVAAEGLATSFALAFEVGGSGSNPGMGTNEYGNIQSLMELEKPDAAGVKRLNADSVKWYLWPRVERGGVLTKPPETVPNSDTLRIFVRSGHAAGFKDGDYVRLHTRPLFGGSAPKFIRGPLRVDDVDLVDNRLLVSPPPDNPDPVFPSNFPAGSVVIKVRRPDPDPDPWDIAHDLSMMHQSAVDRINATHNPLNAKDTDPTGRPCSGSVLKTPTRARNFPGGVAPKPPKYSSWWVGLYENAAGFNCGVYRPTGVCIMRQRTYITEQEPDEEKRYQFCPICRYVMVHAVDPTKHFEIDLDYEKRYPK
jgi:hypothetical protein